MLLGGHLKAVEDIDVLRSLGFDFGEIVFTGRASRELWAESGMRSDSISGFFMIAHGPSEGPPSDAKHLWEVYFPRLCRTLELCADMGIGLLTFHLWMDRRFVQPESISEKKRFLYEIDKYGRERAVRVSLENLSESAEDLAEALDVVPELSITLDVGHGQLLTDRNRSFEIIESFPGSIHHVHLHDNRGGSGVRDDLHLPPGEGVVDLAGIIRALLAMGYNRTATIELELDQLARARDTVLAIISQQR